MRIVRTSGAVCALSAFVSGVAAQGTDDSSRKTCTVAAGGTNATDDAPAILDAFENCGRHGKVVFEPTTYYVNSVLNVTWLEDVVIDLQGTLLVCRTRWAADIGDGSLSYLDESHTPSDLVRAISSLFFFFLFLLLPFQ